MAPEEFDQALFWDKTVCLDCQGTFDPPSDERCPYCGSDAVYSAAFVQRCIDLVE